LNIQISEIFDNLPIFDFLYIHSEDSIVTTMNIRNLGILTCIVLLWYFLDWYFKRREGFVESNADNVPEDRIQTLYETETHNIDTLLDTINNTPLPDFRSYYIKYPTYMKFPLNELFRDKVMSIIKPLFANSASFNNTKIDTIRDIYDLYSSDSTNGTRHFVFAIDINNPIKAFTRKLRVYLSIPHITKFTTDNGDYIGNLQDKDIIVNYIGTDNNLQFNNTTFVPSEFSIGNTNYKNFYNIKNTLYLMDPFITNGKDMVITNEMHAAFENKVNEMKTPQHDTKNGFCYNSTYTNGNKSECIDAGGVWDYPPDIPEECPYYMANGNYPNTFGGIYGDKCQLPKNMQIIGHRYYSLDPQYSPLCYNCTNTTVNVGKNSLTGEPFGKCCDEQKDKTKYPNLITPDYVYNGDEQTRQKYIA